MFPTNYACDMGGGGGGGGNVVYFYRVIYRVIKHTVVVVQEATVPGRPSRDRNTVIAPNQ